MIYENALRILGLKNDFTEDELKKAHRKLANQYHPDRNKSPQAAELMKDINLARDVLSTYLKTGKKLYNKTDSYRSRKNQANSYQARNYQNNNQSQQYNYQDELSKYRNQKRNFIIDKVYFEHKKYNLSKNIEIIIKRIELNRLHFVLNTSGKDKETIDKIFNDCIANITTIFIELEKAFFKENSIDKQNIKETINYDCTLTEFYEQLLKIKEKYNIKEIVKQRLEDEISKYKYFAGYDKITKLIENCLKTTLIEIIKKGYKYNEKDIENMHRNIQECFEKYFILNKKILDLEPIISSLQDKTIKEYYLEIKKSLEKDIDFNDIERNINNLETKIYRYQEEEQVRNNFENNKPYIDKIYKLLIERYNQIIKNYNYENDLNSIKIINSKLNNVLKLFKIGCNEYKDLEFFNLFNYINFENDSQIIEEINNHLGNKNKKVYVRKKDKTSTMNIGDDFSFFLNDEKTKDFYRIDPYEVCKIRYTEGEESKILENYISIEELFNECDYIGEYKIDLFGEEILALYQTNGYLIYQNKTGEICINVNTLKSLRNTGKKINNSIFENKKQMIKMIVEQINCKIDKSKKKNNIYDATEIYNINKKGR